MLIFFWASSEPIPSTARTFYVKARVRTFYVPPRLV